MIEWIFINQMSLRVERGISMIEHKYSWSLFIDLDLDLEIGSQIAKQKNFLSRDWNSVTVILFKENILSFFLSHSKNSGALNHSTPLSEVLTASYHEINTKREDEGFF